MGDITRVDTDAVQAKMKDDGNTLLQVKLNGGTPSASDLLG